MLTWEINSKETEECIYLGYWKVGTLSYSTDTKKEWKINCNLPGINQNLNSCHDLITAKNTLTDIVKNWIDKAGLEIPKHTIPNYRD